MYNIFMQAASMRKSDERETATRYVGNCQYCCGDQKLHNETMVHHGYRRPGDGVIHGDCPAVGEPPYELSCEFTKKLVAGLRIQLGNMQNYLGRVQRAEVTHFEVYRRIFGNARRLEVDMFAVGVTPVEMWARQVREQISSTESQIRGHERTIRHYDARIADWKLLPIRTVEEEVAKDAARREERKAEVAARRAVRAADEARRREKRERLEAKRQAVRDDFARRIRELAASGESLDVRKHAASELLPELRKKKNHFVSLRDLGCEAECLLLGLATRQPSGFVMYSWW